MATEQLLLPDSHNKLPNTRDYTVEDGESWLAAGTKINAQMARSGQTEIDFGAFPGVSDVSLAITGQADIAAGADVQAFIIYDDTDDHLADEHLVDPPRLVAGSVVAGTGFTIYAISQTAALVYGKWSVGWRWTP